MILGNTEHLLEAGEGERYARRIKEKGEEVVELSEKARRLEQVADGSAGREVVDAVALVERTVADPERTYPDAEFRVEAPERAAARAHGLIESAVGNVVTNAVEHNDRATPTVEVTVTGARGRNGDVEIEVADDGPGLPDREREVTGTDAETPLEHSDGLGLWLAHWIVTQSGGEIAFEGDGSRGTTVTIRLPSAAPE